MVNATLPQKNNRFFHHPTEYLTLNKYQCMGARMIGGAFLFVMLVLALAAIALGAAIVVARP